MISNNLDKLQALLVSIWLGVTLLLGAGALLTAPIWPEGVAPALDGALAAPCWRAAASLPELASLSERTSGFASPDGRFLLGADAQNLYLGFWYHLPPGVIQAGQPRAETLEPEVWGSESFEFYLRCGGRRYRFAGNAAGGSSESRDGDAAWEAPWRYRTRLAAQIDASHIWTGEVAIPWKCLECNGIPTEEMQFIFCRTWCLEDYAAATTFAAAADGGYDRDERLATLHFSPSALVMQQLSRNNPINGNFCQEVEISSPVAAHFEYRVETVRPDGTADTVAQREGAVAAGESVPLTLAAEISDETACVLRYLLLRDGEVMMAEEVPYRLDQTALAVRPLFLSGAIEVQARPKALARLAGTETAEFELRLVAPDGRLCASCELAATGKAVFGFDSSWMAGTYRVEAWGGDRCCATVDVSYPGLGEWATAQFPQDIVLPPFTALEAAGEGSYAVWGRRYDYGKSLLPRQITTQGRVLFAAPAALVDAAGRELPLAGRETGAVSPTRAEFVGKAADDATGVAVSGEGFLEYDGVAYHRLAVRTARPLEGLALRLEFAPGTLRYLHASIGSSWGAKLTQEIPLGTSRYPFYPMLWLGMEEAGLQFFTEHRHGWTGDRNAVFTIERRADDSGTVLVHLRERLEPGEEFRFEVGLLASPVKPLPELHPLFNLGDEFAVRPGRLPVNAFFNCAAWGHETEDFFADLRAEPESYHLPLYRRAMESRRELGIPAIFYLDAKMLTDEYPEVAAFREEWQAVPRTELDYEHHGRHQLFTTCTTTGASAFFILKLKELLKRFPFDGVYCDHALLSVCNNRMHGCEEHWAILAAREFYRRMFLVQYLNGNPRPLIVLHNSDCVELPVMTFATHLFNGENTRPNSSPMMHDGKDYLDTYGPAMFACELASRPFGLVNSVFQPTLYLPEEYGGGQEDEELYKFRITKSLLTGTLPHDTIPSVDRCHYGIFDKLFRAYEEFGVPQARFVGYWRHPARVLAGQDIYVSCYVAPDRRKVLAVISHLGKEHLDQEVTVEFDWRALGVTTPPANATERMSAPDPDYQELVAQVKALDLSVLWTPLRLGDFGVRLTGWEGSRLSLHLDHHSFAIVELTP